MQTEVQRTHTAIVKRDALSMALAFNRLSYRAAARRCGVSPSTIGNLMSGARKQVNPETAIKIERGLDVEARSIFFFKALPSQIEVDAA